jgi:hypothetical protein
MKRIKKGMAGKIKPFGLSKKQLRAKDLRCQQNLQGRRTFIKLPNVKPDRRSGKGMIIRGII